MQLLLLISGMSWQEGALLFHISPKTTRSNCLKVICTRVNSFMYMETSKAHPDSLHPHRKKDLAGISIMKSIEESTRPSSNNPLERACGIFARHKSLAVSPNIPMPLFGCLFMHSFMHSDPFRYLDFFFRHINVEAL